MKINQLKAGVILTYASMLFNILLAITYTPIMLRILGQNEFGLYNTVSSTVGLLSLLNLGFSSGYIRYFAKYKKNGEQEKIDKLNGLFLIIFSVIGFVALLLGFLLSSNLEIIFDSGLTPSEYKTAKVLSILLTANLAISFPMSVFSSIINAHEKYVFLKATKIIKSVIAPASTLPVLFWGYGSIGMVLITLTLNLLADVFYVLFVIFRLKCRFVFRGFEKGIFKELFSYTAFIALNMIVNQINWNIDKLLLARYIGTAAVAVYSVGYAVYTYYEMFSSSIADVLVPRVHKLVISTEQDLNKQRIVLTDIFVKVGRVQFLLLGLIASGVVFFGRPFITKFWAGAEYRDSYYVALLLVISASIALTQNVGIEIQRAQNRHRFRSIVYLVMAVFNLVMSIFLCQRFGAIGSAVGTAISLIAANGIVMNIYYHKRCNINVLCFWKNILRMLLGMIPALVIGVLIWRFVEITSIWIFILWVIVYTLAYVVSMWIFSMNRYEKQLFIGFFNKLRAKKSLRINK